LISRRELVFGGIAAGLTNVPPAEALGTSWHDEHRLRRGLNILQPFGWVVTAKGAYRSQPFVNGGSFDQIMPLERRGVIRSAGFDFVRVPVDFGPLLSADNDTTLDRLFNEVMRGVDLYVASGLDVLLVLFSPADIAVWPTVTDGVRGPAFQRLVVVWRRFAEFIATRTDPAHVAVELFNEPPYAAEIKTDPWLVQQKYLFDQVRPVLPRHTLVVTADSFSAIDRLILLNPADYDANTSFKFSGYEPLQLSHQGEGYWRNIHRLTFPPQEHPGGKERAISDFIAAVDADSSLSWVEKARTIHKFTRSKAREGIDTYFDTPCDATYIAKRIRDVTSWAASHGVSTRRLIVGEFGARGDYEHVAADGSAAVVEAGTTVTQANFCRAWREQMELAGLGAWCVHEIGGPAGWNLALGHPPWTFRPDFVAALGLNC
jgi:hypothetical protein